MPLPVLKSAYAATADDLLRFARQIELEGCRHLAPETLTDFGRVFVAPDLSGIESANCITDAIAPPGISPAQVIEQIESHFSRQASRCRRWALNASTPPDLAAPLIEQLLAHSYRSQAESALP